MAGDLDRPNRSPSVRAGPHPCVGGQQARGRAGCRCRGEDGDCAPVPRRFSPRTTTVSDLAAWWLEQQRPSRPAVVARQVRRSHRSCSVELVGSELVAELTAEQVATWQSYLLDYLSPSTVADIRVDAGCSPGGGVDLGAGPEQRGTTREATTRAEVDRTGDRTPMRRARCSSPLPRTGSEQRLRCSSFRAGACPRFWAWPGRTWISRHGHGTRERRAAARRRRRRHGSR